MDLTALRHVDVRKETLKTVMMLLDAASAGMAGQDSFVRTKVG